MRSKTIEDWKWRAFERVRVTDAALERAIRAANGTLDREQRERLSVKLKHAVMLFLDTRHSEQHPSPSDVRDRFRNIVKAARSLRDELGDSASEGLGEPNVLIGLKLWKVAADELPAAIGSNVKALEMLEAAIRGIRRVEVWADKVAKEAEEAVGQKGSHRPDLAIEYLIYYFDEVYEQTFDRPSGSSISLTAASTKGEVGGPFMRFTKVGMQIVAVNLRANGNSQDAAYIWEMSLGAIRERWRKISQHHTELGKKYPLAENEDS